VIMREAVINIKEGQIDNKGEANKLFRGLKDGKYLVSLKSIRRRSNNQNAYLHGVVIPMVYEGLKEIGFEDVRDHEDAKDIIKRLFLSRKIKNEKLNTTIEVVRKTSELTTIEMMEFVADVQRWASEYLSIIIPDPSQPSVLFAEYDTDLKTILIDKG
jgi:hypothetical protein